MAGATRTQPAAWNRAGTARRRAGRRKLNFSEWDRPQKEAHESAKTVRKGEMPPWFYSLIERDARLTASESAALIQGLQATLGATVEGKRRSRGDD